MTDANGAVRLVDTHCHIDLYPDYDALIKECEQAGIATIAVTNTPSVFRRCKELIAGRRYLRAALGLHPELAHQRHQELALMVELLAETRFVGEVGLDFVTRDTTIRDIQRRVFQTVLDECDRYGDKILTVHSRRAAQEVVDMIGPKFRGKVILHWFSGPTKVLERALSYGFYFSVNTAMSTSETGRKLIAMIPQDRLLTESDGPFVAHAGRPARPVDVENTLQNVANVWRTDFSVVAKTVRHNFRLLQLRRDEPVGTSV